ncbi:coilin-like [Impatiens glandulifera]|uniref:coilin-like n=1 Tax=Impatiens glandulifera TaxID=253017 RepID=UPI001FB1108A|nr:coilin-like [Impatiens glandulifera]
MGKVRLRVAFEDRHMLTRLQKSEGLKQSWILLDPQHQTISDISSYLIDAFQLAHTCSNGLILSMDGFVLPPFESVDILKDGDEISVKKKSCKLSNIIKESEDERQLMILDKEQPVHTAIPLLANKEFENETGGYESDIEEKDNESVDVLPVERPVKDAVLKKRKAGKRDHSASKKRKCNKITKESENNVSKEDYESNKIQLDTNASKDQNIPTTENELICAQSPKDKPSKRTKSVNHPEGNDAVTKKSEDIPASAQKVPSRSARRKKAKRIWRREAIKKEMESLKLPQNAEKSPQNDNQKNAIECQSLETDEQMNPADYQTPQKDNQKNPIEFQSLQTDEQMNPTECQSLEKVKQKNPVKSHQPVHNTEGDNDIVPIVIRPGHIRFEPLEKDHNVPENQLPMETFQWNGITSKKQGQKWGKEKEKFSAKRVDSSKDMSTENSGRAAKEKEPYLEYSPIRFEKLERLSTLPQDGDVIAYRLVELSSSWTPELSSFRVGKTSRFDSQSNVILLTPLPEYPIIFEKKSDEEEEKEEEGEVSEQPDNNSLYKEDGSLEIDFALLDDVRIIELVNQDPMNVSVAKPTNAVISDKNEVSAWDEMKAALSAKKQQLLEESEWDSKTAGKNSWSYRALRGSALGPAMAYLRARNDI